MTEEEVAKALPRILGGANEETGEWREGDEVIDNVAFSH